MKPLPACFMRSKAEKCFFMFSWGICENSLSHASRASSLKEGALAAKAVDSPPLSGRWQPIGRTEGVVTPQLFVKRQKRARPRMILFRRGRALFVYLTSATAHPSTRGWCGHWRTCRRRRCCAGTFWRTPARPACRGWRSAWPPGRRHTRRGIYHADEAGNGRAGGTDAHH